MVAEPTALVVGDSWSWTSPYSAYPSASGWVLTYYLAISTEAPKTIVATGDEISVSAVTTAEWPAGLYHWTARVANAGTGEVLTLGTGIVNVRPNPSATGDTRTIPERCAAAIEAALLASASDTAIVEYQLPDGVRVKKDRAAAMRELSYWRQRVRIERGGSALVSIPVRLR